MEAIATLYDDLAAAHRALVGEVENCLAACARSSLYKPVESAPPPEFLTEADVAALLQISARTVRRRVSEGKLPAPIRVSPGRVRWRRQDLEDWPGEGGAA